jgi:hypothetical protein
MSSVATREKRWKARHDVPQAVSLRETLLLRPPQANSLRHMF